MTARELEHLLGGYAAGTLTDSEHSALMRAALDDQQLFDALADEEALRDALADPVFRARLRARLAPEAQPERGWRRLWWLAPALAAGLALLFVIKRPDSNQTMEMASAKLPPQETVAPSAGGGGVVAEEPPAATPPPSAQAAPVKPSSKPAPLLADRLDRESSTRSNEVAPKELREEPATPAAAPPPPPPPPKLAPAPVAESIALRAPEDLNAPVVTAEKKTAKDERAKAATESDAPAQFASAGARPASPAASRPNPAAAVALDLQVERSVNGRFESVELGALRQGDRVRFQVRAPEDGDLMLSGAGTVTAVAVQRGQTYYLPNASGLPPGDAPLDVTIALRPASAADTTSLFRARRQAATPPAGSSLGASRDVAKEKGPLMQQEAGAPSRVVRLRLEFKPR